MITLPGLVERTLLVHSVPALLDLAILTLRASANLVSSSVSGSDLTTATLQSAGQILARLRREIEVGIINL